MAILRYRPGDTPPKPGKYELVDHFGERLNVVTQCSEGERLPLVVVHGFHNVWFVQLEEVASAAKAA
jgi:hypothetical protein